MLLEELHRRRMASWSLLLITGNKLLLLIVVSATLFLRHSAAAPGWSLIDDCQRKCGDVSIPYPFGIKNGCFRENGFNVTCDEEQQLLYLGKNKSLRVLEINVPKGEVRVENRISSSCHNHTNNNPNFSGVHQPIFRFDNLKYLDTVFAAVNPIEYSHVWEYSPCSYAFIAEQDRFSFSASYVAATDFRELYGANHNGVPMVLDWAIGTGTCSNYSTINHTTYACVDRNSDCIDTPSGLGYRCTCSQGYQGNPYIVDGCIDIDECASPDLYCHGTCMNTVGSYECSCRHGTQSKDPKSTPCTPIPVDNQKTQVMFVIGISICSVSIIICISIVIMKECQKRKLVKEKARLFKENGGQMLYQQIHSRQIDTVILFTVEDLDKATNSFDKSIELGTGGHGTVYKGNLSDETVVAVKRSRIINMAQAEEFIQEIIILSQIKHRNVVRLVGCCLEVEVPMLVYEFVPNGTLFHLLHSSYNHRPPVPLEVRLRIAQESADALVYLHLNTEHPIVHGDVKSLNILLDENYMAKVTDFGASRMFPKDADQYMTIVQGTPGYLDPEYHKERQLTEKSDVYSFGVVLLELITRKMAIYSEGHGERIRLASSFMMAMKENRARDMLDTSIMGLGTEELLQEVAELGLWCLRDKGEEKPSMIQVANKLKTIRSSWRELLLLLKHNETELLSERSVDVASVEPLSSMYYTASMLGMDIETPC